MNVHKYFHYIPYKILLACNTSHSVFWMDSQPYDSFLLSESSTAQQTQPALFVIKEPQYMLSNTCVYKYDDNIWHVRSLIQLLERY